MITMLQLTLQNLDLCWKVFKSRLTSYQAELCNSHIVWLFFDSLRSYCYCLALHVSKGKCESLRVEKHTRVLENFLVAGHAKFYWNLPTLTTKLSNIINFVSP